MEHRALLRIVLVVMIAGCSGAPTFDPQANSSVPDQRIRKESASVAILTLDASSSGHSFSGDLYGANLTVGYDFTQSYVNPSLRQAGIALVRFPGGSISDRYHWENGGTLCDPNKGTKIAPNATFDNSMKDVVTPLQLDVAITLNYGSNLACNAGGDPSEAAAWASYALNAGYHIAYWTVGNEVYGSWEYDLHSHPHDPNTYSHAVRSGYYPAMKQADPNAKVGVVVDNPHDAAWNDVVLQKAQPFDFVELHYYPEYNGESDEQLLGTDIDNLATELTDLRSQMNAAGVSSSVPIYLGEYNNTAGPEGKQSVSIVNGLFLGQVIGTLADAGVPMATWWLAYLGCEQDGDFSKQLYGWQNFGSEGLFSPGIPQKGCEDSPPIPAGTPFPTARIMALFADGVPAGSAGRSVNVPSSLGDTVRAYGFAEGRGYALVIFNNTLSQISVQARITNSSRSTFNATLMTYGKAQYDKSKSNQWVGPARKSLGKVGTTVSLRLSPYSAYLLALK